MRVFIGMETSGVSRRAFEALGHHVISCDLLPSQDGMDVSLIEATGKGGHVRGDVFEVLERLRQAGWWPDFALFHPDCTFFTVSAAWAFNDPDYDRYPGVGYHQKVKPETLTGGARRAARNRDLAQIHRIAGLKITTKMIENPIGSLSTLWTKPSDIVQPYEFGDDASKATCLWLLDEGGWLLPFKLVRDPWERVMGRTVMRNGKAVEYWSNQTDTGQNKLGPKGDRWQDRADTYPGIAKAIARQITLR